MSLVNYRREGTIALLQLNNPPFNAFSETLLDDFARCLALYEQDSEARLAVVHGQGADFSIGALTHELGVVYNSDAARPLVDAVEACSKPLIALMHGRVLGAGLELALACHWRLATATARIGLPEIHIGLPPGAGATQRLPRLIGIEPAIKILLEGTLITVAQALDLKLVDTVLEEDWADHFKEIADWAAMLGAPLQTRNRSHLLAQTPENFLSEFRAAQPVEFFAYKAKAAILQALEAIDPDDFDKGYELEERLYVEVEQSGQKMALMNSFLHDEAAAWRIPGRPDEHAPPIGTVTLSAAQLPLGCKLNVDGLQINWIKPHATQPQTLSALEATDVWLDCTEGPQADRLEAFASYCAAMKPDAVIVYAIREGASVDLTQLPEQIQGHALLPAFVYGTGPKALLQFWARESNQSKHVQLAVRGARAIGLACLHSPGQRLLGQEMMAGWATDLDSLLAGGVSLESITRVCQNFGLSLAAMQWSPLGSHTITELDCPLDDEGALQAILCSIANQGCRQLSAGLAMNPEDIDMVVTRGYGYPPHQSGPMARWAQSVVLLHDNLAELQAQFGENWEPAPMLKRLARDLRGATA
ncbi:enoyl-CoA hydratase-related protein [Pseudomonas kielensis]|uniref:enoyl-CoA hydratase/isomerase family protein n=1 Tax=Pseudomonas kielensis TaxID=2762577 RepID=UPI0038A92312